MAHNCWYAVVIRAALWAAGRSAVQASVGEGIGCILTREGIESSDTTVFSHVLWVFGYISGIINTNLISERRSL